jgi:3-ketosteroid 9alpha-monooxygenase subunit B
MWKRENWRSAVMIERFHPLRVAEVIVETEDARSLVFEVPDELAEEFRYRPGQYITLRIPCEREPLVRCYSLSSSPHTADPLRVTVKRTPTGHGSDWLLHSVRAGSVLYARPPAGRFTPASLDGDFLFLAAGSGIAPVLSILKSALVSGSGRVTLIYANRDECSVIFADELAGLVAAHPDRFAVLHWLETLQGLPTSSVLRALTEPFRDREVYVCGPWPFVSGAVSALAAVGVPSERTHVEQFVPPVDDGEPLAIVNGG